MAMMVAFQSDAVCSMRLIAGIATEDDEMRR